MLGLDISIEHATKSIKLLKLIGWYAIQYGSSEFRLVHKDGIQPFSGITEQEAWHGAPNLYDPKNMALAWEVLNWLYAQCEVDNGLSEVFDVWWDAGYLGELPANKAIEKWLDKVLELYDAR